MLGVLLLAGGLARADLSAAEKKVNQATRLIVDGRYAAAEPFVRQAIALDPNNAWAHYNLGVVLRGTGRFEAAVAEYRRAMELFPPGDVPQQTQSLYGIALAQEAIGDPRAAAAAWNDYIQYAQRFAAEQPAVEIARHHLDTNLRLAGLHSPSQLGPSTATRPVERH
jgi:tetratricopeptide (TPR) repeat protein